MTAHNPVEVTGNIIVHHPSAADLLAEAADLAKQAAAYRVLADHHTHTGATFDYLAPLPTSPTYRPREWEAA